MARDDNVWRQVGRYSGMAFILPVSTFVGYVIGYMLDKLFHTGFVRFVFLVLGTVAGFIEVLRELQADAKQNGQ